MARLKLNPTLVKTLLALALPTIKEMAAKTTTKFDDLLVAAVEHALANPELFDYALSLINGEEVPPADTEHKAVLEENAEFLRGMVSAFVAPDGETA